MQFWVYILRCSDGSYYTGHTDNLEQRLFLHQSGSLGGYTSERLPVELVWSDYFNTREDAFSAEMRIKKWSRAKKEALIAGQFDRLSYYSVPPKERDLRENVSASLDPVPRLRSGGAEQGVTLDQKVDDTRPPIIVLVRPQLGENIGKAARAMLNFGLTELRLVTPRDGWPNPDAGPAAAGADAVLDQAQVFNSVADAVADCPHVYATTVRKRGVIKPVVNPQEAVTEMRAAQGRSAILFGAERSGLDSEDVALARTILTVPINPDFSSLNLAQAVILCAYEWSKTQNLAQPPRVEIDPPAPHSELEGLIQHLDTLLEDTNYFFPPDRTPATKKMLRTILTKPSWNSHEVRTLRGVLSSLGRLK
jgi:tRNA/rRNA methyltransferase